VSHPLRQNIIGKNLREKVKLLEFSVQEKTDINTKGKDLIPESKTNTSKSFLCSVSYVKMVFV
jgi:hypothetical protein